MADRNLKPCKHFGCAALTNDKSGYCEEHRNSRDKGRKSSRERGYNARWEKYRKWFLALHPVCAKCERAATVVDHIIPHKGNYELFWEPKNHQPLCKRCHDIKTATEDGGFGRALKG